jgi:hypothetical protein
MRLVGCEQERAVMAASHNDQWDEALRSHVRECEACTEALRIAQWLESQVPAAAPRLPDAGQVWWRAQIRARQAAAERATEPVRMAQRVSVICALLVLIFWLLRHAPHLERWLASASLGGPQVWTLLATGLVSVTAISAGLSYILHS